MARKSRLIGMLNPALVGVQTSTAGELQETNVVPLFREVPDVDERTHLLAALSELAATCASHVNREELRWLFAELAAVLRGERLPDYGPAMEDLPWTPEEIGDALSTLLVQLATANATLSSQED